MRSRAFLTTEVFEDGDYVEEYEESDEPLPVRKEALENACEYCQSW